MIKIFIFILLLINCSHATSNDVISIREDDLDSEQWVKEEYKKFLGHYSRNNFEIHPAIAFCQDLRKRLLSKPLVSNFKKDRIIYRIIHDGFGTGLNPNLRATAEDIQIIKGFIKNPFSLGDIYYSGESYFYGTGWEESSNSEYYTDGSLRKPATDAVREHRHAFYEMIKKENPVSRQQVLYLKEPEIFLDHAISRLLKAHIEEKPFKRALEGILMFTIPYIVYVKDSQGITNFKYFFPKNLQKLAYGDNSPGFGIFSDHLKQVYNQETLLSHLSSDVKEKLLKKINNQKLAAMIEELHSLYHFESQDIKVLRLQARQEGGDYEKNLLVLFKRRFNTFYYYLIKSFLYGEKNPHYFQSCFVGTDHCYSYQATQLESHVRLYETSAEEVARPILYNSEPEKIIMNLVEWLRENEPRYNNFSKKELINKIAIVIGEVIVDWFKKQYTVGEPLFSNRFDDTYGGFSVRWNKARKELELELSINKFKGQAEKESKCSIKIDNIENPKIKDEIIDFIKEGVKSTIDKYNLFEERGSNPQWVNPNASIKDLSDQQIEDFTKSFLSTSEDPNLGQFLFHAQQVFSKPGSSLSQKTVSKLTGKFRFLK